MFYIHEFPVCASRLVHNPVVGLYTCDLPLTAPTRELSPTGLFVAIKIALLFHFDCLCFVLVVPPLLNEVLTLTLLFDIGFAVTLTQIVFPISIPYLSQLGIIS